MSRKFENRHNPQRLTIDQDSDISIRKSPKPTNPNTLQSRLKESVFHEKENQMNLINHATINTQNQIEYLWQNWRTLTNPSYNSIQTINYILGNVECTHEDVILLFYLKQLADVLSIRKKILNANLNILFLQLNESDAKKLFLLKLLVDKLNKKLFFEELTLKKYKKKLIKVEKGRNENLQNRKKIYSMMQVLRKIINKRNKIAMHSIKDSSQLLKLLASQQQQSQFYDKQFKKLEKLEQFNDSLQFRGQMVDEKSIQSEYLQKKRQSEQNSTQYSVSDIVITIRRLSEQMKIVESKYLTREQKLKKVFFIHWKIAFLYKHIQKIIHENQHHNSIQKSFNALKQNISRKQEKQQQFSDLNNEQTERLKRRLSRKSIKQSIKLIKDYSNLKKVQNYTKQIYKHNLLKKVFTGLKHCNQDSREIEQQQQIGYSGIQKRQKSFDQEQQQSQLEINQEQSYQQQQYRQYYYEESQQEDEIQQLSKDEALIAKIFLQARLQAKYFFMLKNILCLQRLLRSIKILIFKKFFNRVLDISNQQSRKQQRVDRFRTAKNKVILFRSFRALKILIHTNESADVYIQHKDNLRLQNAFSILKLAWKQTLIKTKKISMIIAFIQKRSALNLMQKILKPEIKLNTKKQILQTKRTLKCSQLFIKSMLSNYLQNQKQSRKVVFIRQKNIKRNSSLMSKCFQGWSKVFQCKKQYNSILKQYSELKSRELKKKIFWLWMRMALLRKKAVITSLDDDSSSITQQSQSVISQSQSMKQLQLSSSDHRYWLQKYYEQICSFNN